MISCLPGKASRMLVGSRSLPKPDELDIKRRANQVFYLSDYRRMAENGFAPPPPLGNFADISYFVEN